MNVVLFGNCFPHKTRSNFPTGVNPAIFRLATHLRQRGHFVSPIGLWHVPIEIFKQILNRQHKNVDVVGISTTLLYDVPLTDDDIEHMQERLSVIKSHFPNTKIILGGSSVTDNRVAKSKFARLARYVDIYAAGGGGGSGGSTPLSCDIDSVIIDEWFSPILVLNDMGTPNQEYVLQTVAVTGTDSVRLDGRAAFRNTNTTDLVNVTLELFMNGSGVDSPNTYLGAVVPPATGGMYTQIPITISKIVTGLNPSSTYTFTLIGKKQQAVGPVNVLDAYLCASMETITCTGGGGTAGWNSVTTCPVTGPTAGADTTLMYKSSLGEYWVYMGDSWRVISGHYASAATNSTPMSANTPTTLTTFTCHRPGLISISAHANVTSVANDQQLFVTILINGASSARDAGSNALAGGLICVSASHILRLPAGATVACAVTTTSNSSPNWGYGISYVD